MTCLRGCPSRISWSSGISVLLSGSVFAANFAALNDDLRSLFAAIHNSLALHLEFIYKAMDALRLFTP